MDEFLRRAPRTLVAMVALIAGYFLIIAANPPRTVCDEQLDLFKQSQKSFLLNQGKTQRSMAAQLYELCKSENGPGGCFDLFLNLRRMVEDLERMPKACRQAAGEDALIKQWLLKSMTLMVQLAWGETGAGGYQAKRRGWLDAADLRLFCRMKNLAVRFYGDEQFHAFRESVMADLPNAKAQSRDQRWMGSIFSIPCD